ncbi:MAG: cupin domain-containing protein [Thermodesulfobacteriota bacterium]
MKKLFVILFIVIFVFPSFLFSADSEKVKSEILADTGSSWNGQKLPSYKNKDPRIKILKITIPAKAELPLHKHPVINAGVLLKGELIIHTKKGEKLHLKEGEAIVEVVNTWHYGENPGNVPAEIIVFYAGTENLPVTEIKDN